MPSPITRRRAVCSGLTVFAVGIAGCSGNEADEPEQRRTTRTTDSDTTTHSAETTSDTDTDYTKSGPDEERPIAGRWPMFQYDAGRSGRSPASSPPREAVERYWRLSPRDSTPPFTSPPAVGTDAVYVGRETDLESFEPTTGNRRWSADLDSAGEIRFSPAVVEDVVFACTHDTVFAVETESGAVRWKWSSELGGLSAPAIADGTLFVSEGTPHGDGGRLYAIDAADGTERWTFEFDGDNRSAPAIAGKTAYVVDAGGTLYAVAIEDGTERWQFEATGEGYATPVASDGAVFFADGSGIVYRLDPADGAVAWEGDGTTPGFHAAPAVGSDAVYVGGRDGVVALSKADGAERWTHSVGESATSPALAADTVYAVTATGEVLGLHAETGDERWRFEVREVQREDVVHRGVFDGVAVVDGGVFATSEGGDVYALAGTEE